MSNIDFDPYDLLIHLNTQNLQQAENMVRLSDFMLAVSQQTDTHTRQMEALFTMIRSQQTLIKILQEQVIALQSMATQDINNNSL